MMRHYGALLLVFLTACTGGSGGGGETAPVQPTTPTWDAATYPWPMFAQNVRRTGQSPFNGPTSIASSWSYTATGGAAINMQAVVTSQGAFFGTWGLLRKNPALTPDLWEKGDGRYCGVSPAGLELWPPFKPGPAPVGYLYPGRPKLQRDIDWCGAGNDYLVYFYNGTVEGTACVDPNTGIHYVGRGDGRLYAVDPATGTVVWSFTTFNPQDPSDPDGGGEVVGGPVMGPGKILYFGTAAEPWPGNPPNNPCYETNAIYAVDTSGTLLWRYPSSSPNVDNGLFCPPALSLDGHMLYIGTLAGDGTTPGKLMALDLTQPGGATDAQRLKWELLLRNESRLLRPHVYVGRLAVGVDGRIYCAGAELQIFGASPVAFAVTDEGTSGSIDWLVEPQGYPSPNAQLPGGIAVREVGSAVQTVYVSTTHQRLTNDEGGALLALDPATGATLATFDPSTLPSPGVGGMTPPTIGADGTVYVGIRGKHATSNPPVSGHMYAVSFTGSSFTLRWDFTVDGNLDWAGPAVGADGTLYFGSSDYGPPAGWYLWHDMTEVPPGASPKFYGLK